MSRPAARSLTYPAADEPVTRQLLPAPVTSPYAYRDHPEIWARAHFGDKILRDLTHSHGTGNWHSLHDTEIKNGAHAASWLSNAGRRRVDGLAGASYGGVREAWMPAQHG